jgi:DNA-binding LacI/PurR family transcriptional regulator
MTAHASRRPVVGLLVNTFFDGYEEAIWKSAVAAAAEFDVDLLAFFIGSLGWDKSSDNLLDLVHAQNVDGIVALTEALGWAIGPEEVAARLGKQGPLPTVVFSAGAVAGVPRVAVDNRAGVAKLVEHLAQEHGRRRIAFLTGPKHNGDAGGRLQGYLDGIARAGLPNDPELVLDGDFTRNSARAAVRRLAGRELPFDALLCANDSMALAATDELRRQGRDLRGEIAVCGFDDIADAVSADPPLTTVRQPLHEMGREAIRLVLALLRGERVPLETTFPAQLVLRQSCGCARIGPDVRLPKGPRPLKAATAEELAESLEQAFPDFGERVEASSWARELGAALLGSGVGGGRRFLEVLERLLARGLGAQPEPTEWLRILRTILASVRRGRTPEEAEPYVLLVTEGNALVASMASSAQLARRVRSEEQARTFRWLVQPFPFAEEDFVRSLLEQLQVLDVRSFFLSKFLDPDRTEAVLVAHFDRDGIAMLDPRSGAFAPQRLIPGRFGGSRRRAHAVMPVSSPDGLIGFALCEIGGLGLSGYEVVMHELSMVLSVSGLVAEVHEQQRHLLETARQAGMAEVAVGALHNVGNLLNSVSVSAEEIQEAARTVASAGLARASSLLSEHTADLPAFFATDPRAAHLPAYFERATEALGREMERIQAEAGQLMERTGLVRDSIRALQDLARGGHDRALRETVDLPTVVRAALEIQRGLIDRERVVVRQELDSVPPFVAPRSKLVHVLVNLVKNGVEAMRGAPEGERSLVIAGALRSDGRIRLEVRDTGEGIAPEDLERIFAYGFTTKRDGHGFGLHTCANYMKQMGGEISVASAGPGKGTTFTLLLDPEGVRS